MLSWLAGVLAGIALFDAVRRAGWRNAPADGSMWALATVLFLLARQLTVTMPGGVTLQYLGTAWLTLLLGYPRAVVSVAAVMLVDAAQRGAPPDEPGLTLLLFAIAPAWLMWALARVCRRRLPPNLFVFLIGVGFLGLFIAYALPLLAAAALGALSVPLEAATDAGAAAASAHATAERSRLALSYALLLAAGEAWLEGMLTTLLVVFAPGRVRLFDEAHYLARR